MGGGQGAACKSPSADVSDGDRRSRVHGAARGPRSLNGSSTSLVSFGIRLKGNAQGSAVSVF